MAVVLALSGGLLAQEFQVVAAETGVRAESVSAVERMTRIAFRDLARHFPRTEWRPFTVHLHASAASLDARARESLHPGTAGYALLGRDEIHLMLREARNDPQGGLEGVLRHELVHVLLDQHAGEGGPFVPRWFHEGLAQSLTERGYLGASEETLVFRAATGTLLNFRDLVDDFPHHDEMRLELAYRQSWSWVSYLRRAIGLDVMLKAARGAGKRFTFQQTLSGELGHGLLPLQEQWIHWLIHESGAPWRALMRNTFEFCMLLTVPILFLAIARKRRRDDLARERLRLADERSAVDGSEPYEGEPAGEPAGEVERRP